MNCSGEAIDDSVIMHKISRVGRHGSCWREDLREVELGYGEKVNSGENPFLVGSESSRSAAEWCLRVCSFFFFFFTVSCHKDAVSFMAALFILKAVHISDSAFLLCCSTLVSAERGRLNGLSLATNASFSSLTCSVREQRYGWYVRIHFMKSPKLVLWPHWISCCI